MFYRYKNIVITIGLSIWSMILFSIGVTFGSPQVVVNQQEVPSDSSKIKKINEEVIVKSKSEGEIIYTVEKVVYTPQKQLFFQVHIAKMTSFSYIVRVKDVQNQDINVVKQLHDEKQNSATFQFNIPETSLNADVYILIFPASEETVATQQITDKGYGKTRVSIPSVRQQMIDQLQ